MEKATFLKRDQLPNYVQLPYEFDIKSLQEAYESLLKKVYQDDLTVEHGYGQRVGSKCHKLSEVFGLEFNTIEAAYEYLQANDVSMSVLERGLPEKRRMKWDYRNYLKNFDEFIKPSDTGTYKLTGTPYKQIALTEFNPEAVDREYVTTIPKSRLDERHYDRKLEWVKGTVFEDVIDTFKGQVHRARIAVMEPGGWISEHIDYNCDYSVRMHIPITTNDECGFSVRRKSEEKDFKHMPADGRAWFLNQGWLHSAWNKGTTPRAHLILSIYGQQDLLPLV